jgi:hypothetical protein
VRAIEVALDLAEILRAGDDFLTGIAALVETDRPSCSKFGHLRNELLFGALADQRHTGLDIQPLPDGVPTGRACD